MNRDAQIARLVGERDNLLLQIQNIEENMVERSIEGRDGGSAYEDLEDLRYELYDVQCELDSIMKDGE